MLEGAYFCLGRLLYGLIGRRDQLFVLRESGTLLAYLAFPLPFLLCVPQPIGGIAASLVFWLTAVAVLRWVNHRPGEEHVPVGIIDYSWMGIMGAGLGLVLVARGGAIFDRLAPGRGFKPEFYAQILETARFLFGNVVTVLMALGAVLAGCMTILWAGEVWRKPGKEAAAYPSTTMAAQKMVFAFFWVAFGVAGWLGWPLLEALDAVTQRLQ